MTNSTIIHYISDDEEQSALTSYLASSQSSTPQQHSLEIHPSSASITSHRRSDVWSHSVDKNHQLGKKTGIQFVPHTSHQSQQQSALEDSSDSDTSDTTSSFHNILDNRFIPLSSDIRHLALSHGKAFPPLFLQLSLLIISLLPLLVVSLVALPFIIYGSFTLTTKELLLYLLATDRDDYTFTLVSCTLCLLVVFFLPCF
ncbi:hypothetical protein GEMRC1_005811 [Eukaryota sp. GEM-RC1]